jgi:hypothetical protein
VVPAFFKLVNLLVCAMQINLSLYIWLSKIKGIRLKFYVQKRYQVQTGSATILPQNLKRLFSKLILDDLG